HLINLGIKGKGILRNDGRLTDKWLDRYRHCETGGWWCSGVDIVTGAESDWGQFKPDSPRTYQEKKGFGQTKTKTIKYESPPKAKTEIYALRITLEIWQEIAQLNNVPMPQNIEIDEQTGEARNFWAWVLQTPKIPIAITEGAKKAGCLLTAGYVAIALPGIYNGYRQEKDRFGKVVGQPELIPQLEVFAVEGREINFCFDRDLKPKTKQNLRRAIVKTGKLFEAKGCTVKVITWNHRAKGVDDLIAATDVDYFHDRYEVRLPLLNFELADLIDLSPYINLKLNQRYLSESLKPPETAQLIGLSSPKGTGKTEWLSWRVDRNRKKGIKTLVITHRIQLAKALAQRFGIDHIEEMRRSGIGGVFGFALCIDSVHPKSQARFDPTDWEGAHIIIDECEQVIWHQLNSQTCQSRRVTILETFQELVRVAIATGGKIYLSDADLSPIAIAYIEKLIPDEIERWIVQNKYNSNRGKRKLVVYDGGDPRELVTQLKKAIVRGEKPLIHTSGQKQRSGWGTINLEGYFKKLYPQLKILRIDAETVADPQHPAYGCMNELNKILPLYDIVLASPVLETGVSIDIKNHFDSVWCIAWGVQTVDAVCQALERLRDDVPRHIWARRVGLNSSFVGNGAVDLKQLLASTHKLAIANIGLLQRAGITDFDGLDWNWQKAHLEAWARRAIIVNAGMKKYRQSILEKLKVEGYKIVPFDPDRDPELRELQQEQFKQTKAEISANKKAGYRQYCDRVSQAEEVSESELVELRQKRSKTETERLAERKGNLKQRYDVEVTPELVERDDQGWYAKLRLHYYLTVGEQFLAQRDQKKIISLMEDTGKAFKPDINQQSLSAIVYALKLLNIEQFFDANGIFSKFTLKDWFERLNNPMTRGQIKTILGIKINPLKDTPIAVANRILKLLGLKLECIGSTGGRKNKHRIYSGCKLNADGRDLIFAQWLKRDKQQLIEDLAA
nr:DUF3854 domain-containing protein [Prochloraceae cyanobacterium]